MSCSPCGYTYTSSPQLLMTGQHPSLPFPAPNAMPPDTLHGSPAANVCSLGYERYFAATYPRLPELYGATGYADPIAYINGLTPSHPVLYPGSLPSPYEIKDPRTAAAAWLTPGAGYSCDPAYAAYSPYGDRFDPVDSEARRRNATRETTSTLKAWLNEHRKNPYPTKGEKIMLAIITKMTLTQVSTWFANARRRLKKENKMTWEPRNKTGDDLDDVSVDEYDDKDDEDQKDSGVDIEKSECVQKERRENAELNVDGGSSAKNPDECGDVSSVKEEPQSIKLSTSDLQERERKENTTATTEKPKIWSLAKTATSESPPSSRKHPLENSSPEDFKRFKRMPQLYVEPYNNEESDPRLYFNHRNIPVLHPDSSAESSLSSPPSWRTADIHALGHSDKYGRITPLDSSDIVSVSPSSSGSPAIVTSSMDLQNSSSSSMAYSRFMGCRLFPSADGPASGHRPPPEHSQYFVSQASTLPHSLDLRTYHANFLKASPFGHPSGFSVPSLPHPHIQQSSPTATVNKEKENGSHCQGDS